MDPSDLCDLDAAADWPCIPTPDSLPTLAESMPETTGTHPPACRCLPCQADREAADWEARTVPRRAGWDAEQVDPLI